jgi:hypothetical protein
MVDRRKLETILTRRFANARREDVRAAADAIIGIADGWQELLHPDREFRYHDGSCCADQHATDGSDIEFRILQRRRTHVVPFRRVDEPLLGAWEDAWR